MKKLLLILCLALAVMACKKSEPSDGEQTGCLYGESKASANRIVWIKCATQLDYNAGGRLGDTRKSFGKLYFAPSSGCNCPLEYTP